LHLCEFFAGEIDTEIEEKIAPITGDAHTRNWDDKAIYFLDECVSIANWMNRTEHLGLAHAQGPHFWSGNPKREIDKYGITSFKKSAFNKGVWFISWKSRIATKTEPLSEARKVRLRKQGP